MVVMHPFLNHFINITLFRYYWERRQPIDPDSPERMNAEGVEIGYQLDFHVMASKNNIDRPKAEREYFDRPVNYQH
jgi:hypothetical protein